MPWRTGTLIGSVVAHLLTFPAAQAATFTNALTEEQVRCDELQLERLALRSVVREPISGFAHPSFLLWHSGPGGGSYAGLAVNDGIENGPRGPVRRAETQLALDLVTVAAGDPLNPARPLLPRAVLVRRDQDSNEVTSDELVVTVALEANVVNAFQASNRLTINNLATGAPGASPLSSASGRGINQDLLAASCENLLTSFDQRIFTILSRMIRVSQCALLPGPLPTCIPDGSVYNIALFRGADPQTYRANVYWYGESCPDVGPCDSGVINKVAYELKVGWDETGKLTTGQVTVLSACPGEGLTCDNGGGYPLFVLPPLWPGHARQGPDVVGTAPRVGNDYLGAPLRSSASVNWGALLSATAWN